MIHERVSGLVASLKTDQMICVLMTILAFKDQENIAGPQDIALYNELAQQGGYQLQAAA